MNRISQRLREIAKLAVAKYVDRVQDLLVAYPNRTSGANLIVRKDGNYYEIVSLKQNKSWGRQLLLLALQGGVESVLRYIRMGDAKNNSEEFLNLLNHPSLYLRGELLYDISQVAKSTGKLKYYEKVDALKAVKILTLKESLPPILVKKYLPELSLDGEGISEKVGPFEVHFDHDNPSERESIEDLINRTVQVITKFGFKDYLYGKIYVVDKLKGRTIADYSPSEDCIRLSHKARTKEDLRVFIHEIGHRILHKGGVNLLAVKSKFSEALQDFSLDVQPGTILTEKKSGKKYKYLGLSFQGRTKPYKIRLLKEVDGAVQESGDYRVSAFYFSNFDGDFKISSDWLPTAYSKTNHEEWFCEVLSFALTRGDAKFVDFINEVRK